jgi:hypothetical protein
MRIVAVMRQPTRCQRIWTAGPSYDDNFVRVTLTHADVRVTLTV